MTRGTIPGASAQERAVRLAGNLAELGATRLTLTQPGTAPRELAARLTDLPAVILAAPDGSVLTASSPPIRITIRAQSLDWESDHLCAQSLGAN